MAEALDYAHGSGVVHRDLKPANVLLTENGQPILADFGLALLMQSTTRHTQANQVLGTPEYMSPEQVMGKDADRRSDLYSFGVLLYQMLLGRVPYNAETPAATLIAHVHQPLPSSIDPNLNRNVELLLLKALSKEPNDRFQSASEIISALQSAAGLGDFTTGGRPESRAVAAVERPRITGAAPRTPGVAAAASGTAPASYKAPSLYGAAFLVLTTGPGPAGQSACAGGGVSASGPGWWGCRTPPGGE